jgi:hypothetical protein
MTSSPPIRPFVALLLGLLAGCTPVNTAAIPETLTTPPTGTPVDEAARNAIFMCPRIIDLPPLTRADTPWVDGDTVMIADVPSVEGEMTWDAEFAMTLTATERRLVGNGLPNHATGTFPIEPGTVAYGYYADLPAAGYDSAADIPIAPYEIDLSLRRDPVANDVPSCAESIFTGVVSQTGAAWHLDVAPDASLQLFDPSAAVPMDACWGHPYMAQYHYHGYSWKCFPDQGEPGEHSPLFGYAIDGFGVFGPLGEDGEMVTNDELDECHGHTHEIDWDGERKVMYHYHVNNEYPYSIGCFRGTPIELPSQLQH